MDDILRHRKLAIVVNFVFNKPKKKMFPPALILFQQISSPHRHKLVYVTTDSIYQQNKYIWPF